MAELNYGRMMQRAMQGLVAEALRVAAEHGLPGDHHFYIVFSTRHPGVDIPDWLSARFPDEITIVLQYEYSDLAVTEDRFSVRLSFDNTPTRIVVPFDAVQQFADPSAEFGLRFDPTPNTEDGAEELEVEESAEQDAPAPEPAGAGAPASTETAPEKGPSGEVVSLDSFRKK